MIAAAIETPAKVNLGLEIPGRRDDGYHDIVTILCMLELSDDLVVFPDPLRRGCEIEGVPETANLVARALRAFEARTKEDIAFGWHLTKQIPAAAGLGGASGNAAGALLAANALVQQPLPPEELKVIADSLGSDIAFFLGAPMALATGTGTTLSSLPSVEETLLLVVPPDSLENKTAAMYGALQKADFSNGSRVMENARRIERGANGFDLTNAFSRALVELVPGVKVVRDLLEASCPFPWGITGAGPAFMILAPEASHSELEANLRRDLPRDAAIISTRARQRPLEVSAIPWDGPS